MLSISWDGTVIENPLEREIKVYSHDGRKDYGVLAFGHYVRLYLSEPQLRDLAAKIEAELQDRMAETIKLAAGSPEFIADIKAQWKPRNPEAETAQQHYPSGFPERTCYRTDQGNEVHVHPYGAPCSLESDHARANADQVEMLEKEAKNA